MNSTIKTLLGCQVQVIDILGHEKVKVTDGQNTWTTNRHRLMATNEEIQKSYSDFCKAADVKVKETLKSLGLDDLGRIFYREDS